MAVDWTWALWVADGVNDVPNIDKMMEKNILKSYLILFVILMLPISGNAQAELKSVPYRKGNKWGIKELITKKQVLEIEYDTIGPFNQLVTWVKKGKKYGYIDRNGLRITSQRYKQITQKDWNKAKEKHHKKYYWYYGWEKEYGRKNYGICGVNSVTRHFKTYRTDSLIGILIRKSDIEKYNGDIPVLDSVPENIIVTNYVRNNSYALQAKYSVLTENNQGIAMVKTGQQWRIIDKYGNYIGGEIFEDLEFDKKIDDAQPSIKYKKEGKWGFLNNDGSTLTSAKYTKVEFFSQGIAIVFNEQHKMGYIDTNGLEYFED